MPDLFIHHNQVLLFKLRKLHDAMEYKDLRMEAAIYHWDHGMKYSRPSYCLTGAKELLAAALRKSAALTRMKKECGVTRGALTKAESKLLKDLTDLNLHLAITE